jgi:putative transport protein
MNLDFFPESLRAHPELALFLAVGLGTALGRLGLGSIKLGPVLGCLIAGLAVGQVDIVAPAALKSALFALFLFAMGYRTGPLFFRSFEATALPQIVLTLLFCATALGTAWGVSVAFGFDAGMAGGLLAGALTESAALGADRPWPSPSRI